LKRSRNYYAMAVLGVMIVGAGLLWGPMLFADNPGDVNMQLNKLNYILRAVRDNYVEDPDAAKLLEGAIEGNVERTRSALGVYSG
jgi:hypothetical protein